MSEELELDKAVMLGLSNLGFAARSYLRYENHSDIMGEFKAQPPFTVPTRAMVEISKGIPGAETIEGFYNQAKSAQCEKAILVLQDPAKLSAASISLAEKYGIERWPLSELVGRTVSKADLRQASDTLEAVSPKRLVKALPDLAGQVIPSDIARAINDPNRKAWEVFEDAVHAAFRFCFDYNVRKLGKESLFQSEPEGVVTTSGLPTDRFAFIYDCKSSRDKYVVTSQDQSKYIEYILDKKSQVLSIEKCELKYFVIVGSRFGGDMQQRRQNILEKTQVVTVYLSASVLERLAEWADSVTDPALKQLIDLKKVFKLSEPEVTPETVKDYASGFDREFRERY